MNFFVFSVALAILDLGAVYFIFAFFRKRFRDALDVGKAVEEARHEMGALIAELNRTTERNVSLIEDRIAEIGKAIDGAERRFGLIRRESEGRERERAMIDRLARAKPIVPAKAREAYAAGSSRPVVSAPPEAPASGPDAIQADEDRGLAVADGVAVRERGIPTALAEPRTAPSLEEPGLLPGIFLSEQSIGLGPDPGETAVALWESGLTAGLIASRLSMTVAEVDLIIAMEEQRRLTAR